MADERLRIRRADRLDADGAGRGIRDRERRRSPLRGGGKPPESASPASVTFMSWRALIAVLVLGLVTPVRTAQQPPTASQAGRSSDFVPEEATISDTHAALGAGRVTCVQVVQAYLRRIQSYD